MAVAAGPAEAGCLREFEQCGECVKRKLRKAWETKDAALAFEAWLDAIDCEVDLYHCIALGQHHSYTCDF